MQTFINVIHILTALFLILVILLQPGKGGLSAFGGSAGTKLLGAQGASTILTKITGILAVIFMLTSLTLTFMSSSKRSIMQEVPQKTEAVSSQPASAPH